MRLSLLTYLFFSLFCSKAFSLPKAPYSVNVSSFIKDILVVENSDIYTPTNKLDMKNTSHIVLNNHTFLKKELLGSFNIFSPPCEEPISLNPRRMKIDSERVLKINIFSYFCFEGLGSVSNLGFNELRLRDVYLKKVKIDTLAYAQEVCGVYSHIKAIADSLKEVGLFVIIPGAIVWVTYPGKPENSMWKKTRQLKVLVVFLTKKGAIMKHADMN